MSITGDLERQERHLVQVRARYRERQRTVREERVHAGLPVGGTGGHPRMIAAPDGSVSSAVAAIPALTHGMPPTDIDVCRPSCLLTIIDALPARERRYEAMLYNVNTRASIRTVLYAADPDALAAKVYKLFGADVELAGWHPAVTSGASAPASTKDS